MHFRANTIPYAYIILWMFNYSIWWWQINSLLRKNHIPYRIEIALECEISNAVNQQTFIWIKLIQSETFINYLPTYLPSSIAHHEWRWRNLICMWMMLVVINKRTGNIISTAKGYFVNLCIPNSFNFRSFIHRFNQRECRWQRRWIQYICRI